MHGKIYRYIFIETRAKIYFLAMLGVIIVSIVEAVTICVVNEKIKEGIARKELIVQIPEMEQVLYPTARRPTMITTQAVEPVKIGKSMYILKGIRALDGKLSALINDDVYQEDDIIENHRITKITVDSVLFKDIATNEMKILRLGN
ncbi:MAG: hypothetical protein JW847_01665 [Candidatus Omnitrophica bacterium]|nr:hypothetical protein [Candidatus Omnitrophota bacterium]